MIIDSNTMQPVDGAFEIDDELYEILNILWSKGYNTKSSCGGHDNPIDVIASHNTTNEFDRINYGDKYMIYDKKKNMRYYFSQNLSTSIYITFSECYPELKSVVIPPDFKINKTLIEEQVGDISVDVTVYQINTFVDVYNSYNKRDRKNHIEIEKELKIKRRILLDWAIKLPALTKDFTRERKINNE